MLVKLGEIWVDPQKVIFMETDSIEVQVVTTHGSSHAYGNIEEFATIINNAVQSFGGEDDQKERN